MTAAMSQMSGLEFGPLHNKKYRPISLPVHAHNAFFKEHSWSVLNELKPSIETFVWAAHTSCSIISYKRKNWPTHLLKLNLQDCPGADASWLVALE